MHVYDASPSLHLSALCAWVSVYGLPEAMSPGRMEDARQTSAYTRTDLEPKAVDGVFSWAQRANLMAES